MLALSGGTILNWGIRFPRTLKSMEVSGKCASRSPIKGSSGFTVSVKCTLCIRLSKHALLHICFFCHSQSSLLNGISHSGTDLPTAAAAGASPRLGRAGCGGADDNHDDDDPQWCRVN